MRRRTLAALPRLLAIAGVVLIAGARPAATGDEPPLPQGPGKPADGEEPPLPPGPGEVEEPPPPPPGPGQQPPPLPEGPEQAERPAAPKKETLAEWLNLTGFAEVRAGMRTQRDPCEKCMSLGETRLQLEAQKFWKGLTFKATADFVCDPVLDHHSVHLATGQGWFDLRQANVTFSPAKSTDVRVGRQILTWGTGDLIFVNDLFPKDWQSLLIGRDVEYLKAPSDAVKVSLFSGMANVDLVYTPRFDADRYIRGRRLSYYSGSLGRRAGRDAVVSARRPDHCFKDHEWAVRVSRRLGSYELAAYGYWGYWKSPAGTDAASGRATFPRLGVYGASIRGPFAGGIGNAEVGYYDSRQDRGGEDPLVRNSELRLLLGYERDLPRIARDLTVAVQYYLEWMTDYGDYRRTLPAAAKAADERRHVITFRVSKLLMNQKLTLSLFAFYSPSDGDAYLRPRIAYKIDDHWSLELGGNVFFGRDDHTFFGQFSRNSSIYAAVRYGF
jgi:hypothetical protein